MAWALLPPVNSERFVFRPPLGEPEVVRAPGAAAFEAELLRLLPTLRTFALSLCRNATLAEDLVQDTAVAALSNVASFRPGSNMRAWLCAILRNQFYSQLRKRRREIEDVDCRHANSLLTHPAQPHVLDLDDIQRALNLASESQRAALLLIAVNGYSYEEAAALSGCAVGTVKSRVNRARLKLRAAALPTNSVSIASH